MLKSNLAILKLITACLCLAAVVANAQQPPAISFAGIDGELLANVQAHVALSAAQTSSPVLSDAEMVRLRRAAPDEIKEALQPFGYYRPTISVDRSVDRITYQIDLGAPLVIKELNIAIRGQAAEHPEFVRWRNGLSLESGKRLRQMDYENAKKNLLALTLRYGFFDAKLSKHQITIAKDLQAADVTLVLDSGVRYQFGSIEKQWKDQRQLIRDQVLVPYIKVNQGDDYDSDKIAVTQRELQETPYFSGVEVRPELNKKSAHQVPIVIVLNEQKRHAYNLAVGAGTDTGVRASVGYENRRLNNRGHHLNGRIGSSNIRQTAILNYRIPLASAARDSLNMFASLEEEDNDFRRFSVSKLGAELSRKWRNSTINMGVTASREKFFVGQVEKTTDLILPSIGWQQVVTDDHYAPTRGWSAAVTLRGASESLGSDVDLTQLIIDAKGLVPFAKGRLLMRVKAAGSDIDDALELPASLGFLTGGDRSIRGYRYESIGVSVTESDAAVLATADDDDITVGRHLLVGSVEYEHPLKNGFAMAAFFDAGDAFNNDFKVKRGAGAGLRWRLPFGALKLDLASALDRAGKPLRLHLSFGTDL